LSIKFWYGGVLVKILVTGGAGFIGSHTVNKLIQEGCQVIVVDNLSSGRRDNIHPDALLVEMDICNPALVDLFSDFHFDGVIHLAAQTMVPMSLKRPEFDCRVNVRGTVNVLESCRRAGVRRIIFSSSAAVYGNDSPLPIKEDTILAPTSFYGLSKQTAENYISMYSRIFGIESVILRYANVYGERQGENGEGGVVSIFAKRLASGDTLTVFGNGEQTRDFVYAGDVAIANWLALITPNVQGIFNVSTSVETSINTLINTLFAVTGQKIGLSYKAPRTGDIYRSVLDNSLIQKKLGWRPSVSLEEGLVKTWNWINQVNKHGREIITTKRYALTP